MYNFRRLRRPRKFLWSRNLILEENILSKNDFILALFVCEGFNIQDEIENMPGVYIFSIDKLIEFLKPLNDKSLLNAIMLFPKILKKSKMAEEAYNPDNLICRTIKKIRENFSDEDFGIISDVALDPYTLDGHDGISDENSYVLNDITLEILAKQSINQALAGSNIISPSDMMDGRIGEIRNALDKNNFHDVQIMSYAVKFHSSFYSPFRKSIGSITKKPIDKSSYQLGISNSNEAMREIEDDIGEMADSIIIKPCLFYGDIFKMASQEFNIPIIAYLVSGEYAMIHNAIKNDIFSDEKRILYEAYISLKRYGAKAIITYKIPEILF